MIKFNWSPSNRIREINFVSDLPGQVIDGNSYRGKKSIQTHIGETARKEN